MQASVPELNFVSWEEFALMVYKLALKIEAQNQRLDTIVSISRGGHVVSRILSDHMKLPIFNVSIQSYEALQQKEIKLTQRLGRYLDGQAVLLVDEIVDSGRSLARAMKYLNRIRVKSTTSVAVHVKPGATPLPDLYVELTGQWVVYPYEIRETVESLAPVWKKAGLTSDGLMKVLVGGGMKREIVRRYLKDF